MARRRPKGSDDARTAFPTEGAGDVAGISTLHAPDIETAAGSRDFSSNEAGYSGDRTDEIARLAYERFQQRGGEHGHDQEDWYEAERAVRGDREEQR